MSNDAVIDMSVVLGKLVSALKSDTRTSGMIIESMRRMNKDANVALNGWVGLYAESISYQPRAIGRGARNWKFMPKLRVIVQAANIQDSTKAFASLGDYLKSVLDVVLSNLDLSGSVYTMNNMDVTYAIREDDPKTLYFVGAMVTLTYEGSTI